MSIDADDAAKNLEKVFNLEGARLVRALEEVRVAAADKNWHTERCPALYEERPQGCTCGADALTDALAACDAIMKGEG